MASVVAQNLLNISNDMLTNLWETFVIPSQLNRKKKTSEIAASLLCILAIFILLRRILLAEHVFD